MLDNVHVCENLKTKSAGTTDPGKVSPEMEESQMADGWRGPGSRPRWFQERGQFVGSVRE